MRAVKPWPNETIWDKIFANRAQFALEFAVFEQHKGALIGTLCGLHEGSSVTGAFDESGTWHALKRAAYRFFRRPQILRITPRPGRRKERLLELAKALDKARDHLLKAVQDDVGVDLYQGWSATAAPSALIPDTINDEGRVEIPFVGEIKELTERLLTIVAAARTAADDIYTKRGAPRGSGLLALEDINALAAVYRSYTGKNPILRAGPFAEFVEQFLTAVGRGDDIARDYVAETFDYWREQMRK